MSEGVSLCVGPGPAAVLVEGEEEARRGGSLVPSVSMINFGNKEGPCCTGESYRLRQGDGRQG